MANSITVSTGQMTNKATELRSLNAQFKEKVELLKTQENTLKQMWEGEANEAFHNSFNSDVVQMNNFYNAIENYVNKLNDIAGAYETVERQNQAIASKRNA